MLNRISLDGFIARPNGEIDWHIHDPEVDKAAHGSGPSDTLLLGRETYQIFESYWPHVTADPNTHQAARVQAEELNQMTKVVFSTTLQAVTWVNSRLVKDLVAEEAQRIKQGHGANILIFGSGTIVQQLAGEGLIDEYLIVVTPVVLGTGKPLYKDVKPFNPKLLESSSFNSGNVLI